MIETRGKIHDGDSEMYTAHDSAWLETHHSSLEGFRFRNVWHYAGSVRIAGDLILDGELNVCVVVDGDLEVDGDVYVCADALVVRGDVRCSAFESWDSRFIGARAIRAQRDIAFTALGGAMHEIDAFETPILICLGVDRDALIGNAESRIEHTIDIDGAPDGVGDSMVLELVRTRTDEVLALLRAGTPIWGLLPRPAPKRLVRIVEAVRAGATLDWTELSGKPAVRVISPDGSKQLAALTVEERATLEELLRS